MYKEPDLNEILLEVEKLSERDKTALLKHISKAIQVEKSANQVTNLNEISGLGASIWHDIDIDKYIDDERSGLVSC